MMTVEATGAGPVVICLHYAATCEAIAETKAADLAGLTVPALVVTGDGNIAALRTLDSTRAIPRIRRRTRRAFIRTVGVTGLHDLVARTIP